MKQIFCLPFAMALLAGTAVHAQPAGTPKHFTNSNGMKFVWVPPGAFVMGSPDNEEGRNNNEIQHKVTLSKGYYLGVTTVTKSQWNAIMSPNAKLPKREHNLPKETVSWDDAQEFIKKLRAKDGKPYRLPTEAEWEHACRAGTTPPFFSGKSLAKKQANFGKGMKGASKLATTAVGSYPANPWGLYDMHGNVWEWCQDWFDDYPAKDVVDPQGPKEGQDRVLRGGSFADIAQYCRSAMRHKFVPDGRDQTIGVRICFSAP